MIRHSHRFLQCTLTVGALALGLHATAGIAAASEEATAFLTPAGWNAGDTNTIYQHWDDFSANTGNEPDAGYLTGGSITQNPTVDVLSPGFRSGTTANFYSFMGDYGFEATIYNHGGTFGAGGLDAGLGTHVIVQIATTMNPEEAEGGPAGVFPDSVQIVALDNSPITGGTNLDALQNAVIATTLTTNPFLGGTTTLEERIWEFFLPGYTGDFKITGEAIMHGGISEVRIDTALATDAYSVTPVPEPASAAMVIGSMLIVACRRKRRSN